MTVDTILIDSVDLKTAARIIQVWGGVHTFPEQRGSGYVIPNRHGIVDDIDRPFVANVMQIGLMLRGGAPDVTGFNDQLRALVQLVKPGKKVVLTRRLSYSSGNEDHTTTARCLPFVPDMASPADGRIMLEFLLLDGLWYAAQTTLTTTSAGATVTVAGDVRTRKLSLDLPSAGTLTNVTTGTSVTVTASATLDVPNRTTTGSLSDVVAAGDPLGAWFSMDPGSNALTWTGTGTVQLHPNPAYV